MLEEVHILTPGQSDALWGTYEIESVNRYALTVAVCAPFRLSVAQVKASIAAMTAHHPVLRMNVTSMETRTASHQRISAPADTRGALFIEADATMFTLQDVLSEVTASTANRFDVINGHTWGIALVHAPDADRVVFVFNHLLCDLVTIAQFVRTFTRATVKAPLGPVDTYLPFLRDLEDEWSAASRNPEVERWNALPWTDIPTLLVSENMGATPAPKMWLDRLSLNAWSSGERLHQAILRAAHLAIQEVLGASVTRVDTTLHGRDNRNAWAAGGWLATSMPTILDHRRGDEFDALPAASAWRQSFATLRGRSDLTPKNYLGGHMFVNFFGSASVTQRAVQKFSVSQVQPHYEVPERVSITPMRLKVQRGEHWHLEWSLGAGFTPAEKAREVMDRVTRCLSGTG